MPHSEVRGPFPLPDSARAFVDTLRPVLKPGTWKNYVGALRDLHAWLAAQDISLDALDRGVTERWLKYLADRGLTPATRNARIFQVRRYLAWLFEHHAIVAHPDDLLRLSDLPKIPSYLPRPFPQQADRELQRRFQASGTAYGQALFLMRRSGVRIGELIRLEPCCLENDLHENAFLKVPLGKLDNERLVPLDDETRQVLEILQQQCPNGAPFLLAPRFRRDTLRSHLLATLKDAAIGLDIPGPVVSHRLRHTFATELLNAGLSLTVIMKLLGHRSLHMTMRYAAITQDTVVNSYHSAMARITAQYELPANSTAIGQPDPERMLSDTISWLRNNASEDARTHRLIKRIYKLRDDIADLAEHPHPA